MRCSLSQAFSVLVVSRVAFFRRPVPLNSTAPYLVGENLAHSSESENLGLQAGDSLRHGNEVQLSSLLMHPTSFPGSSQVGLRQRRGEGLARPATHAPRALPVILVLPQSRLIGIIGSWLCQARCEIPCSLFKFILRILVGAVWEERIQDNVWGRGWVVELLRV